MHADFWQIKIFAFALLSLAFGWGKGSEHLGAATVT
jgi:hypothetical protein